MRRGTSVAAALAVTAVLAGAGCGGGAPSATTPSTSSAPSVPTTSSTLMTSSTFVTVGGDGGSSGTSVPGAKPAITSYVPFPADLEGGGWSMTLGKSEPEESAVDHLRSCSTDARDRISAPASRVSVEAFYTGIDGLEARYQVDEYPTAADAAQIVDEVAGPEIVSCLPVFHRGVDWRDFTFGPMRNEPSAVPDAATLGVDRVAAEVAHYGIGLDGSEGSLDVTIVMLQKGPVLGHLTIWGYGGEVGGDPVLASDQLLRGAAAKLVSPGG